MLNESLLVFLLRHFFPGTIHLKQRHVIQLYCLGLDYITTYLTSIIEQNHLGLSSITGRVILLSSLISDISERGEIRI